MNWTTILPIILGSSLLSAIVTTILDRCLSAREKSKYNKFIALTLAHDLESYSWQCADSLSNHELARDSQGHAGKLIASPPDSFVIPKENYRDFDIQILDRVFNFPLAIRSAKSQIQFWDDVTGQEDAFSAAFNETCKLGSDALNIANSIRDRYGLSKKTMAIGTTELQEIYKKHSSKIKQ